MLHEQARNHIVGLTDEELAEYIQGGTELYQHEALEFAREEFSRRNLSPEAIQRLAADASDHINSRNQVALESASRPLGSGGRIAAFIAGLATTGVITPIVMILVSQSMVK